MLLLIKADERRKVEAGTGSQQVSEVLPIYRPTVSIVRSNDESAYVPFSMIIK
jgi:hypothetical protein